jgi:hypothetical protein
MDGLNKTTLVWVDTINQKVINKDLSRYGKNSCPNLMMHLRVFWAALNMHINQEHIIWGKIHEVHDKIIILHTLRYNMIK